MSPDEQTIALCIGHSRFIGSRRDGGAVSVDGTSEWDFNARLARLVAGRLHDKHGISSVIIDDYEGSGYSTAMSRLALRLREQGDVGLAVELHFNSYNGTARGHEWLHWHTSKNGKRLATELHLAYSRTFPKALIPSRGVKAVSSGDRGGEFLRKTHCPAVICEPFFGDNPQDWHLASTRTDALACAIADGLAAAFLAIP